MLRPDGDGGGGAQPISQADREQAAAHSPLPLWLAPLGRLGAPLYRVGIGIVNRRYDRGLGVKRFDRPVISVGNLSAGGTGKTPLVIRLVEALQKHGHKPCIAMRGYKRGEPDGAGSDESEVYLRRLPGVCVVAQPDRIAGITALLGTEDGRGVDCLLLDDGFQHRRIARDLDIVTLDASRDVFTDRLLPAGRLREPVSSLGRATAAVITHAEMADSEDVERMIRRVQAVNESIVVAVARHEWTGLMVSEAGADRNEPVSWLQGGRAVVVCAIGNPWAFIARVRDCPSLPIVGTMVLPDHDPYRPETVHALADLVRRERGDMVLTTDKDWSKLRQAVSGWPCPVVRPILEMKFDRGWDALAAAALAVVERPR